MKHIVKKALAAVAAVACLGSVAACGSSNDAAKSDGPKITIGIKFDQPGLGFKKGSDYTGFDVDVAKYVAKDLGYSEDQIVWKEAPSKQRETLIQNGDVDLIFATYTINDKRKEVVDFAGPYFVAGQDLLIRNSDAGKITGPDSLNGKKLCSVTGSTSAQNVKDKFASEVQLMEQTGYAECVTALISGTVDAVTTDDIILAGLAAAKGNGQLKVVGKTFSEEPYGVGLKKGDTELKSKVNASIKKMIEDGSWQKALDANTQGTGYTPDAKLNAKDALEAQLS